MIDLIEEKVAGMSDAEKNQVYKNLFESDAGKIVLEDLRQRCFSRISTVDTYSGDVSLRTTLFKEGMRSVVLHIENQLRLKEDDFNKEPDPDLGLKTEE